MVAGRCLLIELALTFARPGGEGGTQPGGEGGTQPGEEGALEESEEGEVDDDGAEGCATEAAYGAAYGAADPEAVQAVQEMHSAGVEAPLHLGRVHGTGGAGHKGAGHMGGRAHGAGQRVQSLYFELRLEF